jgi:glycogen phosphorylase
VRLDGWQEDADDPLDPTITPLVPMLDDDGHPYLVTLPLADRTLHVGAWRMTAGSVPVYLLDTNLEVNDPQDRGLSLKLYAGGPEMRLRQEWVLGVGGVRLLRKLGVDPGAWHANEGHAAFMLVERLREHLAAGMPVDDAVRDVRAHSVFTTHTPVPAGHDVFTRDQVERCASGYLKSGELEPDMFYRLGKHPVEDHGSYHMTITAIRLSGRVNGVSELHGEVTRGLWRALWPKQELTAVPIGHVTNGVHLATWLAHPMMDLLDRQLGGDWGLRLEDPALWDAILRIDAVDFWDTHAWLKRRLLEYIREEARRRFREHWKEASHLVAAGTLLSEDALTIGFARRFATYKRADLLFSDPDRLNRLLTDERRPVQLVFAGKAHPADEPGKRMLQTVYGFARDPAFEGRITFLEDHEMHLEHRLIQGVDLWLNLPRVPLEACGTSGMKAAMNGVPQLGTLDGWWAEGYTGKNGWAIPIGPRDHPDEHDADHVFRLLETEIVPLYFTRDARNVPEGWVTRMRHALREALARFTGRTMVKRYVTDYYGPALRGDPCTTPPPHW